MINELNQMNCIKMKHLRNEIIYRKDGYKYKKAFIFASMMQNPHKAVQRKSLKEQNIIPSIL